MGWFDWMKSEKEPSQEQPRQDDDRLEQKGPQPVPTPENPKPDKEHYRRRDRGLLGWLRDSLGGWLGPRESRQTPVEQEVAREHVRSGPPNIVLPWFAPYMDEHTGETATMRLAYRRMLADPNVKAAILGKILGVCALDLNVIPADKKKYRGKRTGNEKNERIADFVRWNLLERVQGCLPELAWSILSGGLVDGYSVSEKVWAHESRGEYAGKYILLALKPKDTGNDVVLMTDEYRNVVGVQALRYSGGEVYSPAHFVIYRHLSLFNSPVGMSDLRAVYSRWWMLDTVLKLRAMGLEKRALPVLIGEYETTAQKPSLETAMGLARSQSWISVPKGVQVKALEIAGAADAMFASAVADLKEDIFLGIQGATLQALTGQEGALRGSSKVHQTTADLFKWHLARCLEVLLNDPDNGLVRDLVDLNYVTDRYPRCVLSAIDTEELLQEAQLDQSLLAMGLSLSKAELYEKYSRTPPDEPVDELMLAPPMPPGGAPPPAMPGMPPGGGPPGEEMPADVGMVPPADMPQEPPPAGVEEYDEIRGYGPGDPVGSGGAGGSGNVGVGGGMGAPMTHMTRQPMPMPMAEPKKPKRPRVSQEGTSIGRAPKESAPTGEGPLRDIVREVFVPDGKWRQDSPQPPGTTQDEYAEPAGLPVPAPVPQPGPIPPELIHMAGHAAKLARHAEQFHSAEVVLVHLAFQKQAALLGLDLTRLRELVLSIPILGGSAVENVRAAYELACKQATNVAYYQARTPEPMPMPEPEPVPMAENDGTRGERRRAKAGGQEAKDEEQIKQVSENTRRLRRGEKLRLLEDMDNHDVPRLEPHEQEHVFDNSEAEPIPPPVTEEKTEQPKKKTRSRKRKGGAS